MGWGRDGGVLDQVLGERRGRTRKFSIKFTMKERPRGFSIKITMKERTKKFWIRFSVKEGKDEEVLDEVLGEGGEGRRSSGSGSR